MMTKEETMNLIINDYKNGNQSAMSDYCDRTKCGECPFDFDICVDEVNNTLIDRLTKTEEHQETNLEHYYGTADIIVCTNINGIPILAVCEHAEKAHEESKTNIVDWLLSPYEPPKPKYKLTQFEHDLLASVNPAWANENNEELCDFGYLTRLIDKGYFKDVPTDIPIGDILDNAEVINE